jgi:hypothetical protein
LTLIDRTDRSHGRHPSDRQSAPLPVANNLKTGSLGLFVNHLIPAKIHPPQRDLAHFGPFRLPLAVVAGRELVAVTDSALEFAREFNVVFA